jgi:hypothetical protein
LIFLRQIELGSSQNEAYSSVPLGLQRITPVGDNKGFLPLGQRSGISKNSVKKTVRGNAAELLSDERSEEFNESSDHEKVFSCFVEAGELDVGFAELGSYSSGVFSSVASFFADKKRRPRRGNDKRE